MEAFQLSIRNFPSGHKPSTAAKSQPTEEWGGGRWGEFRGMLWLIVFWTTRQKERQRKRGNINKGMILYILLTNASINQCYSFYYEVIWRSLLVQGHLSSCFSNDIFIMNTINFLMKYLYFQSSGGEEILSPASTWYWPVFSGIWNASIFSIIHLWSNRRKSF